MGFYGYLPSSDKATERIGKASNAKTAVDHDIFPGSRPLGVVVYSDDSIQNG